MRALVCGPRRGRSAAWFLATSVAVPTYRSVGACEGARGSTPSEPADPRRTSRTVAHLDMNTDTDTDDELCLRSRL